MHNPLDTGAFLPIMPRYRQHQFTLTAPRKEQQ